MWLVRILVVLCAVGIQGAAAPFGTTFAFAEVSTERYALIIGINRYDRARSLQNATPDAEAVGIALSRLGYALYGGDIHRNLEQAALLSLFRDFAAYLPDDSQAIVYIAGHGVSFAGDSYIIPSNDLDLRDRSDLADVAVPLRALTGRLAGRTGVDSVLLIDACRANALRTSDDGLLGGAGGVGDLVAPADGSVHLIYAAAPGQIASDGGPEGGPFAAGVISALVDTPMSVSQFFERLSGFVLAESEGSQQPWMITTLGSGNPVTLGADE